MFFSFCKFPSHITLAQLLITPQVHAIEGKNWCSKCHWVSIFVKYSVTDSDTWVCRYTSPCISKFLVHWTENTYIPYLIRNRKYNIFATISFEPEFEIHEITVKLHLFYSEKSASLLTDLVIVLSVVTTSKSKVWNYTFYTRIDIQKSRKIKWADDGWKRC